MDWLGFRLASQLAILCRSTNALSGWHRSKRTCILSPVLDQTMHATRIVGPDTVERKKKNKICERQYPPANRSGRECARLVEYTSDLFRAVSKCRSGKLTSVSDSANLNISVSKIAGLFPADGRKRPRHTDEKRTPLELQNLKNVKGTKWNCVFHTTSRIYSGGIVCTRSAHRNESVSESRKVSSYSI